jgi:hypothetical protein
MFRRLSAVLLIGVLVVLGSAGVAGAAKRVKPGATTSSSIAVDPAYGAPHLGGYVRFITTFDSSIQSPRIEVLCYVAGTTTLGWATAGAYSDAFKLGGDSSTWQRAGGPADCTANLYWWNNSPGQPQTYNLLASTQFYAAAS